MPGLRAGLLGEEETFQRSPRRARPTESCSSVSAKDGERGPCQQVRQRKKKKRGGRKPANKVLFRKCIAITKKCHRCEQVPIFKLNEVAKVHPKKINDVSETGRKLEEQFLPLPRDAMNPYWKVGSLANFSFLTRESRPAGCFPTRTRQGRPVSQAVQTTCKHDVEPFPYMLLISSICR